jgi:hypothetical protein
MRGGGLVKFDMQDEAVVRIPPTTRFTASTRRIRTRTARSGRENPTAALCAVQSENRGVVEYVLPEPYGFDRESWVDNSTDPVTSGTPTMTDGSRVFSLE